MSPEDRVLYRFAPFGDGAGEKKDRKLESFRETFSQLDGSAYMRHFREQGSVNFSFSGGIGQETRMEINSPDEEATNFAATKIRALCIGHEKSYYKSGKERFITDVCALLIESAEDPELKKQLTAALDGAQQMREAPIIVKMVVDGGEERTISAKENLEEYLYSSHLHTDLDRRDRLENMAKPLLVFEAHSAMQNLFRVCDYFNTIIAMRHLVVTGAPEAEIDQLIAAGHA
jgi:hypothetical protein